MSTRIPCAIALLALVLSCAKARREPAREQTHAEAQRPAVHEASTAPPPAEPALHHGLAWYSDAPEAALAAAKQSGRLLLVDLWAAWCHTCLSMREYVLTDEHLASVRERLVFLALDTERSENAAALVGWPIAAWPTFYLVDGDRQVYGRWVGAASPAQLVTFVRDGLRAYDAAKSSALRADDPLALLIAGDRLAASERLTEARDHYQRALSSAPSDWPRRADALVALAGTLRKLSQFDACADVGLSGLEQTGSSASATDFAYHVLGCASALDARDPRKARLSTLAERRLSELCFTGSPQLTPDDRGDACGLLRELSDTLQHRQLARKAVERRLAVLSAAATGVPDAIALTYDFARVESLLYLKRGEEAIELLRARERALPDDYNPPHYLARTFRDLGRYPEGLEAVERALSKVEGPRRAGILGVKVDLLLGAGRKDEAKRVLEQQLAAYRALEAGHAQPAREQSVAARLAAWK